MLSIQDADMVAGLVAEEFSVPPPPPLYVTSDLSPKYAGAFYHNGSSTRHIKIRPEYLTERTIAHEVGHYIYLVRAPETCRGAECERARAQESEEIARMIEKYWIAKRKREGTYLG